jgi:hypothetical protein
MSYFSKKKLIIFSISLKVFLAKSYSVSSIYHNAFSNFGSFIFKKRSMEAFRQTLTIKFQRLSHFKIDLLKRVDVILWYLQL